MAEGFCTQCGKDIESFEGLSDCPHCHTSSVPCSYDRQVKVDINIHELRVLFMWAERYVMDTRDEQQQAQMAHTLRSIEGRVSKQIPKNTKLFLSDELGQLRSDGFDVETNMTEI